MWGTIQLHSVTSKDEETGLSKFGLVDSPLFELDELSVSFEKFVESLKVVIAPDAPYGKAGWTDLFCWQRCQQSP